MATHPAIFERPLAHEEAVRNVQALLAVPRCRVISEEEGFCDRTRRGRRLSVGRSVEFDDRSNDHGERRPDYAAVTPG
jgi:hypothetical protein